jgi:hypothetical protein
MNRKKWRSCWYGLVKLVAELGETSAILVVDTDDAKPEREDTIQKNDELEQGTNHENSEVSGTACSGAEKSAEKSDGNITENTNGEEQGDDGSEKRTIIGEKEPAIIWSSRSGGASKARDLLATLARHHCFD